MSTTTPAASVMMRVSIASRMISMTICSASWHSAAAWLMIWATCSMSAAVASTASTTMPMWRPKASEASPSHAPESRLPPSRRTVATSRMAFAWACHSCEAAVSRSRWPVTSSSASISPVASRAALTMLSSPASSPSLTGLSKLGSCGSASCTRSRVHS